MNGIAIGLYILTGVFGCGLGLTIYTYLKHVRINEREERKKLFQDIKQPSQRITRTDKENMEKERLLSV